MKRFLTTFSWVDPDQTWIFAASRGLAVFKFHQVCEEGFYDPDWVGGDEGRMQKLVWE